MLHTTSIHYFEGLQTNIRKRKPSQYSGEDIAQMAEDNKEDTNELTIAGQYEFNLNNVMVDNFLEASRAEHNSYCHEMLNVSAKIDKALIEIGYMDKEAAAQHLEAEELTHENICDKAENAYRTLFDKHQWPAARPTIRDSKAPYAKMAKTFTPDDVQNHAYALIHQQTGPKGKAKPDDICLNCGEKGHWARDCKSDKKPKRPFNNNKKSKHQKDKHRPGTLPSAMVSLVFCPYVLSGPSSNTS
ncbi:unnamed protein product [Cylindrotheca closterium]|uniref:CCHC-type domain-containing protein n=1 Tax=Cylindrotheca closterium TaxID=2856 RepID=A0AAD2GEI0_9STRA|nr:unnamed protein product [Cylindrotheca closterium]